MDVYIDRSHRRITDAQGRFFDPTTRRWEASDHEIAGEPASLSEALKWLQTESGRPVRVPVGVIGTRMPTTRQADLALEMGRWLAHHGLTVLCGGRSGVMESVCQGASSAGGLSIGLLPDEEPEAANDFVSIPLATGIGVARNALIARAACCLVAIGGGNGTLSEIAFALQFKRPVLLLEDAPIVNGAVRCSSTDDAFQNIVRAVLRS